MVWSKGKDGDQIKNSPIAIEHFLRRKFSLKLNKLCLVFIVLGLTITTVACSKKTADPITGADNPPAITSPQPSNENTPATTSPTTKPSTSSPTTPSPTSYSEKNISEKVTDYIINGQGNIPDADKIKWSKTFLKQVDIESLYKQYIANGGNANDLKQFAIYMTQNAPIPSNFEALFEKDLYDAFGEKVARLEHLQGDLYQAYVVKDGSEVPYVVVSSRTGYFHG